MGEIEACLIERQVRLTKDNIGNRKIFVLDTNVLIHNPQSMFSFLDNVVVIPIVVIEEIDNFKKGIDEKGRNARQVGRYLDKLRMMGSLKDGVHLENNGYIIVTVSNDVKNELSKVFFHNINDNLIIGTALLLKNQFPNTKVVLVSKDANVRIKADAIGLRAENYETETIVFEELFSGIIKVCISESLYTDFLEKKIIPIDQINQGTFVLYPNEFVKFYIDEKCEGEYTSGRYSYEKQGVCTLNNSKSNKEVFNIRARNEEQEFALDLLLDDDVKLVSIVGKAGTGKTLLAIAAGLHQVIEKERYSRLVVSRPISPLGKDIGFLPGSKADKFNPWMQPIYDNMEIILNIPNEKGNNPKKNFGKKKSRLQEYIDFGIIELEPLTYIRGRSLPNQYIIIDESQNLTPHEMKTIISRAGEGTKIVITGDPYQIDIPYLDSSSNGLAVFAERLKKEPLVGHITLEKGERSKLADLATKFF